MDGHGEKQSRLKERLIAGLLQQPSIERAAATAGIDARTARRWLKMPGFQRAFRRARRAVVEAAVAHVQQTTGEAAETLRRNLTCGHAGTETRAALGILQLSVQAVEAGELAQRVAELESLLKELRQDGKPTH